MTSVAGNGGGFLMHPGRCFAPCGVCLVGTEVTFDLGVSLTNFPFSLLCSPLVRRRQAICGQR